MACARIDRLERIFGDKGYQHQSCVLNLPAQAALFRWIRARHENMNRRLKSLQALSAGFRHVVNNHSLVFGAIATVVHVHGGHGRRETALRLVSGGKSSGTRTADSGWFPFSEVEYEHTLFRLFGDSTCAVSVWLSELQRATLAFIATLVAS